MYLRIFGVSQVPINLTHTHRKKESRSRGSLFCGVYGHTLKKMVYICNQNLGIC